MTDRQFYFRLALFLIIYAACLAKFVWYAAHL